MKLHHPSQHQGPTFDPRRFFEEVVPAALHKRSEAAKAFASVIRFELTEPDGSRATYTVDMTEAHVCTTPEGPVDAQVVLPAQDLEGLLTGKLDPQAAQADDRLRVTGDPTALAQLAILLRP